MAMGDNLLENKNVSLSIIVLVFASLVYVLFFANAIAEKHIHPMPSIWWILQFVILTISIVNILNDDNPYTLNKMHWYFMLAFMALAPIVQLTRDYYPWNYRYTDEIATRVSWMLVLWCLVYSIVYRVAIGFNRGKARVNRHNFISVDSFSVWMIVAIPLAIVALKLFINGSHSLLLSGVFPDEAKADSVPFSVADKALSAIPFFCLAILKIKTGKHVPILPCCLLLVAAFFIMNPISTSRYQLGSAVIGIAVIFITSFRRGRSFDFLVILALFVLFPLMTDWARVNDEGLSLESLGAMVSGFNLTSGFEWVDFDAYSLAARTLIYVDAFGLTMGHQLISALFFFIPDSIWKDKGQMTSDLLVDALQPGGQTNLSTPLMAEAYIDFGLFGVIVFAIAASYLFAKADYLYWHIASDKSLYKVGYPFLLGFVVFVMRGTFLYGFMWTVSFFLGLLIICLPVLLSKKRGNHEQT